MPPITNDWADYLKEEYKNLRTIKRSRQNFISNNKIISVGIPNKICSR